MDFPEPFLGEVAQAPPQLVALTFDDARRDRTICALGVAQIVSWGTLFYTIAVLGQAQRTATGVSVSWSGVR